MSAAPVKFSDWELVLHRATVPSVPSQAAEPVTEAVSTSTPVSEFLCEWEDVLDEKKDDKKDKDPKKKATEPKKKDEKKAEPKAKSKKDDDTPKAAVAPSQPFAKVRIERTPSAQRATAIAVAAVLGGRGYLPRGETPEAIIINGLLHYAKTGHTVGVDGVAVHVLDFARHMGIKIDPRAVPSDLKKLTVTEATEPATSTSDATGKMSYQTNPILRQQATELVVLLLQALGATDAADDVASANDWGKLTKYAQMIVANATKIGGGRGGDTFTDALTTRLTRMGLIQPTTEPAAKD